MEDRVDEVKTLRQRTHPAQELLGLGWGRGHFGLLASQLATVRSKSRDYALMLDV